MIEVKKVGIEDISNLYPALYKQIFQKEDANQCPSFVYVVFENGEYIGFLSGYLHNLNTFYIQYAGTIEEQRGYKTISAFKEVLKRINTEYQNVIFLIKNDNITAIKIALHEGFKIYGIRQDTEKNLYVEFIKGGLIWKL